MKPRSLSLLNYFEVAVSISFWLLRTEWQGNPALKEQMFPGKATDRTNIRAGSKPVLVQINQAPVRERALTRFPTAH